MASEPRSHRDVRYEPDDRPPLLLTTGLGLQYAMLAIASIIITPTVMISTAGGSETYLTWAVFAALVVSGIATIVQALRIGRIGAGYILVMGSTGAFLAISVSALQQGGPKLLATLIVMSSLVQFVLATRMSLLRRIFTPTVAGTVLMLIPVTIAPLVIRKLYDVPEGTSAAAAPVVAGLTLLVTIVIALRSTGIWRLWAPAIGIVTGTLVAAIIAIPGPVAAAYLIVIFALIFVFGIEILMHDGLDYRKSLVVGIAFWFGLAFQLEWIFPEYFQGAWSDLLANGMTVGGLTVIVLTLFSEAAGSRRRRIRVGLNADAYTKLDTFLTGFAAQRKWSEEMTVRVRAVGEETLNILMGHTLEHEPDLERRLLLIAHDDGGAADLEFIAATGEANLEDRMVALGNWATGGSIEEMPLRLLRHYAASVRHQQYYDTDVVTVRVESTGAA